MQQGQLNQGDYDRERFEERVWGLARERGIRRRRFFELVGLAGAGSILAGCSQGAAERRPGAPASSATTPGALAVASPWVKPISGAYTTPNDLFFIRNHTTTARIDRGSWRLRVQGSGVAHPLDLGYDELVKLGQTTVTALSSAPAMGGCFSAKPRGTRRREAHGG